MISIHTNCDAVVLTVQDYAGQIPRAVVRAMNRAIASGRTAMVREMARDLRIKAKDVRDEIKTSEATIGRPVASISAPLKRIPIMKFGARQTRTGVTANTATRRYPSAFIATMPTGHIGVFVRRTKGRLPIRELKGPSYGHVFNKFKPIGIARTEEAFVTNFDHELVFAGATPPPAPPEDRATD